MKAGAQSACGASCKLSAHASTKQTASHGRAPCKPIATIGCPGDAGTSPGPEPENRTRGARWLQARSHKLAARAPREQRARFASNERQQLLPKELQMSLPFHVLIIGGGIGGLTLAQGLRRARISAAVYERDRTLTNRLQGYRVHISPTGGLALRECLPPHLFAVFDRTCGHPPWQCVFSPSRCACCSRSTGISSPVPIRLHATVRRVASQCARYC